MQTTAMEHFRRFMPLVRQLVKRDLKVKYRRSVLGYLWSLLNPLLMMCVMSFVFTTIFQSNIPNYPLYLICGQTLWNFFNEATNRAMFSIIDNGQLIKKVYIPKFIFPLSRVYSSFVMMSFSLAAILIVMVFTRAQLHLTLLLFWLPLIFLFFFCCGVGLVLAALATYFRDVTHLYGVITMLWMYATPIFYDAAILPENVQATLALNPMNHYIAFFRSLILYGELPGVQTWAVCIGAGAVAMAAGLTIFRRLQRNFILYI